MLLNYLLFSASDPSGAAKRFRRKFHQKSAKVLQISWSLVLSGRFVLGCQKVPEKVPPKVRQNSTKVPSNCHQSSSKILQGSWSLLLSGAGPSSAAKKFRGRFHQRSPSFVLSLIVWARSILGCQRIRFGLPKGSVENPAKVPPRFYESCVTVVIFKFSGEAPFHRGNGF